MLSMLLYIQISLSTQMCYDQYGPSVSAPGHNSYNLTGKYTDTNDLINIFYVMLAPGTEETDGLEMTLLLLLDILDGWKKKKTLNHS